MRVAWSLVVGVAMAVGLGWLVVLQPRVPGGGARPLERGPVSDREAPLSLEGVEIGILTPARAGERQERMAVDAAGVQLSESSRSPGGSVEGEVRRRQATPDELAEFRDYVETARREIRAEDASERRRSLERKALDLERRIPELSRRLRLNEEQAHRLGEIMRREQDREAEYILLWERGAEEAQIDELRRRDREDSQRELREFLTAEQIAELPRR